MKISAELLVIAAVLETVACQYSNMFGFGSGGGGGGFPGMAGMGFVNPFGGNMGMGSMGFGNAFTAPELPVAPDPAMLRANRLAASEEHLSETLTESAKNDPGRQRVTRMLQQSGGQFTGDAAPLNYIIKEYYMTTPGPVPPPNPAPNMNMYQPPTQSSAGGWPPNGGGGGMGRQMGQGPYSQMGPGQNTQMGPGPNTQYMGPGPNTQYMGPGPKTQTYAGPPPKGRASPPRNSWRGRQSRRGQRRQQAPIPTTTALPEWEQWLYNSQSAGQKPKPPANNQYPPPQQGTVRNARPPKRRGGVKPGRRSQNRSQNRAQTPRGSQNSHPSVRKTPARQAPPPTQPPNQPPPKTAKVSNGAGKKRTSIAVERLNNIQRRIDNLLKSQPAGAAGAPNPQLDALRQIRDILSGKKLRRMIGEHTQAMAPPAAKKNPAPPPAMSHPPYMTRPKPPPKKTANTNNQPYPPKVMPYDAQANTNNQPYPPQVMPYDTPQNQGGLGAAGPSPPAGPWHGPPPRQPPPYKQPPPQRPVATTVAPKLGDVRYIGRDKFVLTDADGFDTFQWVKSPPGQGQGQNNRQNGQNKGQQPA